MSDVVCICPESELSLMTRARNVKRYIRIRVVWMSYESAVSSERKGEGLRPCYGIGRSLPVIRVRECRERNRMPYHER